MSAQTLSLISSHMCEAVFHIAGRTDRSDKKKTESIYSDQNSLQTSLISACFAGGAKRWISLKSGLPPCPLQITPPLPMTCLPLLTTRFVSLEQKRLDGTKPYDAKTACWIPDAKEGFLLGKIVGSSGDKTTVQLPSFEVMSDTWITSCGQLTWTTELIRA